MNEKEFDQLLNIDEERLVTETKQLQKQLKRKVFMTTLKQVLLLLVLVCMSILFVSKGMNMLYYNPLKPSDEVKSEKNEFQFLMQTYTGLFYPQHAYLSTTGLDQSKGFASYSMYGRLVPIFGYVGYDNSYNVQYEIKRNHLDTFNLSNGHETALLVDLFVDARIDDDPYYKETLDHARISEDIKQEINALPDSSRIEVAVSFDQAKSLEEVCAWMMQYKDSDFSWIALQNQEKHAYGSYLGIQLQTRSWYDLNKEADKHYPQLQLQYGQNKDPKQLQQAFVSRLQLLLDHQDFLDRMPLATTFDLEAILNQAKQEPLQTIGVYALFTKAEFIEMMKEYPDYFIHIHDVSLSILDHH